MTTYDGKQLTRSLKAEADADVDDSIGDQISELRKLAETAAQTGPSSFPVEAISDRERQMGEITERLLSREPGSIEAHLSGVRQFVTRRLQDVQGLLSGEGSLARAEIKKHVGEVRMSPQHGASRPHYLAEGAWDLLGKEPGPSQNTAKRQSMTRPICPEP